MGNSDSYMIDFECLKPMPNYVIAEKKNHSNINNALTKKGLIPYKFNIDSFGTSVYEL